MTDFIQTTLSSLRPDTPDWFGWAEFDLNGNRIPENKRMCWEHAIVIRDGVTKPTQAEFDAKYNELVNAEPLRLLRQQRNQLLTDTDWRMVSDYPGSNQSEWQTYRQALRDITTQSPSLDSNGNLTGVTWPLPPND